MVTSSRAIAVVGLGCILPDAANPSEFWANLLRGHSSLRTLSSRTYDWSCYQRDSDSAGPVFENPTGAEIGFLPFDWRKFRIAPLDAQAINPMHLHALEAGAQALEEVKNLPHATTGVFVGGTGLGWQRDSGLRIRLPEFLDAADRSLDSAGMSESVRKKLLAQVRRSLEERLRPVSDDGVVNSLCSIAAGRLALRFDLRGPHAGIDAGFASGLAAVAEAAQLLRDGTIDLALAGGASESITPLDLLAFHHLSVLSRGRVRPFDAAADGTLLGEGAVLFALKRIEDALEHGERIYALLSGIGAASDGRSRSLLAPSVDGQTLAMERAYADAALDPTTVGYVECHATGTPIGDASEIHALARVFGRGNGASIAVGSAKPFVGHLRGASGAVGLLRAVLALHHGTIPAQIGFEKPHPNLEIDSTPFFVPVKQLSLEPRGGAPTARAAVSSFGLGGNNYHAVLEAWTPSAPQSITQQENRPTEPIAIVGLGGVLPGADGVPAFWKALIGETDAAREVPNSRWAIDRYYDPDQNRLDTTYTRVGCFVEPTPDPGKEFRVPPVARAQIDPGQMLAFRAAEEAVSDAKLESGNWDRNRTAVILGFLGCQGRRMLAEARLNFREFELELKRALVSTGIGTEQTNAILSETEQVGLSDLPLITEDTLPGYLGSINAARIARRFDLRGPHFVVDSACASSLAALHSAVRMLRQGVVDTVLLGGVWADGQPEFFVQNCRFSALSASAITPFDERANGFIPGEGAAVLVLRRLADAERDGQRVHALIRSVEGSSDGGAGRSIYSPSSEGESLAMQRTLDAAAVAPDHVDYVECHGTGTALGDLTEIQACTRTYGKLRRQPLLVGSVKSNVGHLMAGAGAVALLKTALAIREGTIPASIKVQKLNPKIDFASGPVEVVTKARSWEPPDGRPRRAGVSGFGLGGTNFHALLEEYRPAKSCTIPTGSVEPGRKSAARTLPIATAQGSDLNSCAKRLTTLAADLQKHGSDRFWTAIASSQKESIGNDPVRIAIVAGDPDLLVQRVKLLNAALDGGRDPSYLRAQGIFVARADPNERVAAVFPGQGPQYPNMLRSAAAAFPELDQTLDQVDRAYEGICGRKLRPSFFADDTQSYLQCDEDIHCAVFAVNVALFKLLESYGTRIDAVMGQSAGEISALVAARSISLEGGLRAVRERTLAVLGIQTSDPGRMVALSCGAERAQQLMRGLSGYAALAADNGPSASIVSGDQPAIQGLLTRAANQGIEAKVLAVSHGYHSQLIASARPRYRKALDSITFVRPGLELISSITGDSIDRLPVASYPAHLESQFVEPVRLRQAVAALHRTGVRLFVECGPKWPLTTFISEILAGSPFVAQATIHPKVGEVEQLHRALACLFVHRVCELNPARKPSMSESNSPISLKPVTQPRTPCTALDGAAENELLTVLRTIRELIDGALRAHDRTASEQEGSSAGPDQDLTTSEFLSDDDSSKDSEISSPLTSAVIPQRSKPLSAPSASVPSLPSEELRRSVHCMLIGELIKRTGYPEDMLELDMDLEAELGIDTVKQVASLAAVREHHGLQPDPKFRMQDARTLRQAVDYLVQRLSGTADRRSPSPASVVREDTLPNEPKLEPHSAPAPLGAPAGASPTAATFRTPEVTRAAANALTVSEDVRRLLATELVNRTGYPEDMLELDLDLEAELGIDTVKQVAALAAVREHFGLQPDPQFRMQDARTLRQAIDYLARRITSESCPLMPARRAGPSDLSSSTLRRDEARESPSHAERPSNSTPSPQAAPQPPPGRGTSVVADLASTLNGLQECLKSLATMVAQGTPNGSTSSAPGIAPSPAQAAPKRSVTSRSVYPEVLLESLLPQAGYPSAGESLEVTSLAVADADAALPVVTQQEDDLLVRDSEVMAVHCGIEPNRDDAFVTLHVQDSEGQVMAKSRLVRTGKATLSVPTAILNAVVDGRAAPNHPLLRDYLDKTGRATGSAIEWAHSQGFTLTVGGARLSNDDARQSRALLSILGCAYDIASFAWFGLTGTLHSLSAVERLCFHRVPIHGDEMLICARMAQPEGGLWRADVTVFDPSGVLYAEFSGLEGTPITSTGSPIQSSTSDPAGRAWSHFAQRLGRESAKVAGGAKS